MDIPTDAKAVAQAAAADAIEHLCGPVEAARKVGAPSYQSVQSWRDNGVPIKFCRKVHELTGIALDRLRPDDWHVIWPELIPTPKKQAPQGHKEAA